MLDSEFGPLGMGNTAQFTRFLQVQHAARIGAEEWLAHHPTRFHRPPAQTPMLARDLAELGSEAMPAAPFHVPQSADPTGAIWALAGSSLGNQMILKKRRDAGLDTPPHFLSNPDMAEFFRSIRDELAVPCEAAEAQSPIDAASAVFASFASCLQRLPA